MIRRFFDCFSKLRETTGKEHKFWKFCENFLGTLLHEIFGQYVQNTSKVMAKPIAKTSFDIYFLFSALMLKMNDF